MHDAAVRESAAGPRFHSLAHGPNQTESMALILSGIRKGRPPARLSRRNRAALCSPAQQFQTPPPPPRTIHVLGGYKNPRKVNYWTLVGGGTAVWPSQGSQTRIKIEGRLDCLSGLSGLLGLSCCRIGKPTRRIKRPGDCRRRRARGSPIARNFLTRPPTGRYFSPALPSDCFAIDFPGLANSPGEGFPILSTLPLEEWPGCPLLRAFSHAPALGAPRCALDPCEHVSTMLPPSLLVTSSGMGAE